MCMYVYIYIYIVVYMHTYTFMSYIYLLTYTYTHTESWRQVLRSDNPRAVHGPYHPFQQTGRPTSKKPTKLEVPQTQNPFNHPSKA